MASAISFFNGPAQRSNSATLTWLAPVRVTICGRSRLSGTPTGPIATL